MQMVPRVVDISRYETVTDGFAGAREMGLWGVIAKATQGLGGVDPKFVKFIVAAHNAGLRVGAYHFGEYAGGEDQADHFLDTVKPTADMLVALDFERNELKSANTMSSGQMVHFLRHVEKRLSRKAVLYAGARIKETIDSLSSEDRAYVTNHRLWLPQYGSKATLPHGFSSYFLHQYTGDGAGPSPHLCPGIHADGGLDLNVFDGDRQKFDAVWSS